MRVQVITSRFYLFLGVLWAPDFFGFHWTCWASIRQDLGDHAGVEAMAINLSVPDMGKGVGFASGKQADSTAMWKTYLEGKISIHLIWKTWCQLLVYLWNSMIFYDILWYSMIKYVYSMINYVYSQWFHCGFESSWNTPHLLKEPRVSSSSVDDDSMMVAKCSWPKND